MTDDDRNPGAAWDLIEDLLAEEEIERVAKLPAEERRKQMQAQGIDPERAHALASEVLTKQGFAPVASAPVEAPRVIDLAKERGKRDRQRRPAMTLLLVAAAVAVAALGGGAAIVAYNKAPPAPPTPAPPIPTAPPGPSPEELAEKQRQADGLRQLASADCAAGHWASCRLELQGAAKLDPKGDGARSVQRMRDEATRGANQDAFESKASSGSRSLPPDFKKDLRAAIAPSSGQSLRLVCARAPEPSHLCDQLAAAITSAGWAVTRAALATDAGVVHGIVIDVATDADDATQNAADALAAGLGQAYLRTRGPHDAPPGGDAPLRLTVGVQ